MRIRSVVAVAMLVIGVGQAEAATIVGVNMKLRYEGTYYDEGFVYVSEYDSEGEDKSFILDNYLADGNDLGIPVLDTDLKIGDKTHLSAKFLVPDDQNQIVDYYDNGGQSLHCHLGNISCGATEVYISDDWLSFAWSEYSSLYSGFKSGDTLRYTFNLGYYSSLYFDWGWVHFKNRTAVFTLLADAQVAPVPLPETAALLPLGLGALAMMRRRRSVPN